jgi:hypothetical protein
MAKLEQTPAGWICITILAAILLGAGSARVAAAKDERPASQNARASESVAAHANKQPSGLLRHSAGLYAVINLGDYAGSHSGVKGSNTSCNEQDGSNIHWKTVFARYLKPAWVQGLLLEIHWCFIQPNSGTPIWSYITDALEVAKEAHKNIQLVVTPGFDSAPWVLSNISASDGACEGWFKQNAPGSGLLPPICGEMYFPGYHEKVDGTELPLPWDPVYNSAQLYGNNRYIGLWAQFVYALGQQPFAHDRRLVSIAIAGPTAGSPEMILPNDGNASAVYTWQPDQVWRRLEQAQYKNNTSAYVDSDQGFVDHWNDAIKLYEDNFSNITLILTPGNGQGLPPTSGGQPLSSSLAGILCAHPGNNTSCAAVATILDYFVNFTPENGNGKATQVSGMIANGSTLNNNDADIGGVKYLSELTGGNSNPTVRFQGGAAFNKEFSTSANPEQAAYDVLATFVNGTPGEPFFSQYPGESPANPPGDAAAPINYLQVYYQDVDYALKNRDDLKVVELDAQACHISGQPPNCEWMTAAQLLCEASTLLADINSTTKPRCTLPPPPSPIPPKCTTPISCCLRSGGTWEKGKCI